MTDDDTCVYCDPHLVTEHDDTGCQVEGCPCGYSGDWHPEPQRDDL